MTWKKAKEVMLGKPNKLNYTTIKTYRVISFLHCLSTNWEKVVADLLAENCEVNDVLHKAQMRSRKWSNMLDTMIRVFNRV